MRISSTVVTLFLTTACVLGLDASSQDADMTASSNVNSLRLRGKEVPKLARVLQGKNNDGGGGGGEKDGGGKEGGKDDDKKGGKEDEKKGGKEDDGQKGGKDDEKGGKDDEKGQGGKDKDDGKDGDKNQAQNTDSSTAVSQPLMCHSCQGMISTQRGESGVCPIPCHAASTTCTEPGCVSISGCLPDECKKPADAVVSTPAPQAASTPAPQEAATPAPQAAAATPAPQAAATPAPQAAATPAPQQADDTVVAPTPSPVTATTTMAPVASNATASTPSPVAAATPSPVAHNGTDMGGMGNDTDAADTGGGMVMTMGALNEGMSATNGASSVIGQEKLVVVSALVGSIVVGMLSF